MSKIDEIRTEMMNALKAKDKARKDALSILLSALKNKAIDKRADLTQEEENAIILKEIKQCQETIDTAPQGREDIKAEAAGRMAVYQAFAPQMMSETKINDEIDQVLRDLNLPEPEAKDKGLIMKSLMPRVKGKADGALVNQLLAGRFH